MNPEERSLLERSLKLSEDNHRILLKLQRAYRWGVFWGFVKVSLIVIPLTVGYFLVQPYLDEARSNYNGVQELINSYQSINLPF